MRIRELDLLRYGHFTDAIIALPAGRPDFQMLLGENEAGKSTAMNGVEDLLFGIPANSSRNFLHEYNAMRVGALLEKGSDTLKLRRRKGNKDTLLGDDDTPIPSGEGALAPFLAGADRRFYTRMAASACAALGFMLMVFARRQCRPVGFGPLVSGHVRGQGPARCAQYRRFARHLHAVVRSDLEGSPHTTMRGRNLSWAHLSQPYPSPSENR